MAKLGIAPHPPPDVKGDVLKGDVLKGDVLKGDVLKGDVLKGDVLKGDVLSELEELTVELLVPPEPELGQHFAPRTAS